jgi:hypothetical protein
MGHSQPTDSAAPPHLPPSITLTGETDRLMNVMVVFLIFVVVFIGLIFFRLHALRQQIANRTDKVQLQLVAVCRAWTTSRTSFRLR